MNLLVLLGLLAAAAPHPKASIDQMIRGDWCAGSRNAFHEQFSLSTRDGVRIFQSWLHDRPALNGTWEVTGQAFVIRGENGDRMEYKIVRASRTRLVVRNKNRKDNEVYVRQGKCVPFSYQPDQPDKPDQPYR